jgi:hypothetical protein
MTTGGELPSAYCAAVQTDSCCFCSGTGGAEEAGGPPGPQQELVAEAPEPLERSVVKVEKVACLLMRESGFFMAALSTGFKEAKDMALDYHADSEQVRGSQWGRGSVATQSFTTALCIESRHDQEPQHDELHTVRIHSNAA